MSKPIADLHCHPSLKPHLNKSKILDIWQYQDNPTVKNKNFFKKISIRKWILGGVLNKMATKTQSNLDSCFVGDTRLLFCSIYPFERPFLKPDRPFTRAGFWLRAVLKLLLKKRYNKEKDNILIRLITGISKSWANTFLDQIHEEEEYIDYFKDYKREYDYLVAAQGKRPQGVLKGLVPEFKLVKNYDELLQHRTRNTICGIISAEGIHALGRYKKKLLFEGATIDTIPEVEKEKLKTSLLTNLAEIKKTGEGNFSPFFITFSHHFTNLLCGQAESFAGLFKIIFNQTPGIDTGLTTFGEEMICELLSRDNGPRILIDTKHMSTKVRAQYYRLVDGIWKDSNDRVPIIASHTAVNGLSSLVKAATHGNRNKVERKSYVSKFDINITDEDIKAIFRSDGIIGVLMHDGRMPGGKFKKKLKSVKKYPEMKKRLYSQMFLTNIFHIVKVNRDYIRALNADGGNIKPAIEAWKTVTLGSDNDGIVDPYDTYTTAADLPDFKAKLIEALKTQERPYMKDFKVLALPSEKPFTPVELQDLMMGQTAEAIADRIFFDNIDAFLSKYFTTAYRNKVPLIV